MGKSAALIAIGILLLIATGLFFLSARNWGKARYLKAAAGIDGSSSDSDSAKPRTRRMLGQPANTGATANMQETDVPPSLPAGDQGAPAAETGPHA